MDLVEAQIAVDVRKKLNQEIEQTVKAAEQMLADAVDRLAVAESQTSASAAAASYESLTQALEVANLTKHVALMERMLEVERKLQQDHTVDLEELHQKVHELQASASGYKETLAVRLAELTE
jgi:predicted  nucleic acid-binding Zn-ribbon protein